MSITAAGNDHVICPLNQRIMKSGSSTNIDKRQKIEQPLDSNNKFDSTPDKPRILDVVAEYLVQAAH